MNQSFIGSSGSANNFYCDSPNTAGAGYAYGYTIIISTPTGTPSITSFTPASGNSGDTVIITGTNFSSTASSNTVKFNGVSATVTQASSTSLTVTVPTGATSGTISVTNGGLTGTSASSFTVGVAVITSFTPTTGRVGTAIKISGSNFDTTSIVKFNGTLSSIFKDYEGYFYANVPSGATTGKISIQNSVNTATSSQSFTVDPSTSNLRIFVSAGTQQGAMSYNSLIGTEAADAFCNADTNRPDLTKTYKALLNKKAIVVLKANTSYYRSNGTTLVATTTTSGNLLPTTLTNSISTTATTVWTGYNGNGDVTADCYGFLWTWYWSYGNSVSTTGITAIANSTSGYLQSGATVNCTNYYNVFCVEQ